MNNHRLAFSEAAIDMLLADALAGKASRWPRGVNDEQTLARFGERIRYHGIGAILTELIGWPETWPREIGAAIKRDVLPRALWELRHKIVLTELIATLTSKGIASILLKGTGMAYEYYSNPVLRTRGDTDLLIAVADLPACRAELVSLGYYHDTGFQDVSDELKFQEPWSLRCNDETLHHVDLHWQVLNSPALEEVITYADCVPNVTKLPRLSQDALTLNRTMMLVHTLLHRASHIVSPYLIDNKKFYGGDRLIWANDISLLSKAMSEPEWKLFCRFCLERGIAAVCLDGLRFASQTLSSPLPEFVIVELESAPLNEPGSRYLLKSFQISRSMHDLAAMRGWSNKIRYIFARLFPSRKFIRDKYPEMPGRPLILLYSRRLTEFFQARNRHVES